MNLIEDLIVGITKSLSVFKLKVYTDEIKTNMETPSFLIQLVDYSNIRYPSNRFKQELPIQIIYFPDTRRNKPVNFEIYEVISNLSYLMEIIELEDGTLVRGMDMEHNVENNVLHFYVNYSAMVREENETPLMGNLNQLNGVDI